MSYSSMWRLNPVEHAPPKPPSSLTRMVCMTCSEACRSHHPSSVLGSQVQPLMHSTLARPMPCTAREQAVHCKARAACNSDNWLVAEQRLGANTCTKALSPHLVAGQVANQDLALRSLLCWRRLLLAAHLCGGSSMQGVAAQHTAV